MEVVDQEGSQTTGQSRGGHSQVAPVVPGRHTHIEQGHRQGHTGCKAVHTVGQVHGVYSSHHNKGGKDHIQHPGNTHDLDAQEGNIQIRGQIPGAAENDGKHNGSHQLQQELLRCGQALIGFVAQLLHIIDKTDDAKDQGKRKHHQMGVVSLGQLLPTCRQDSDAHGQNKHQAAHGGGALLGHVPGGSISFDGLTGLQAAQNGDQNLTCDHRDTKRNNKTQNVGHVGKPPGFLSLG